MDSTEVSRSRIVVVAIGLAIAAFAYAVVAGTTAGEAARQQQPDSTREAVEAEIARTNVVERLSNNLGDAYGGAWFEPSTAQLHVGVTSVESRRLAEAIAASVGLAERVREIDVRSTQAELEAAHERWDERLADLFESGDVVTATAPDLNAVLIELSPVVSSSRRALLESQAATDEVDAAIVIEPDRRFESVPGGNCNAFAFKKAYCNPTLVSGVSIKGEEAGKEGGCTAGPLVVRKDRTTPAKATETFVLTAGHCFKYRGGNGKKWSAFNQAEEQKEIGKSLEHLIPPAAGGGAGYDVGVIKDESKYWAAAGDPPAAAARAEWSAVAETAPTSVLEGKDPTKGMKVCISGQRSSVQCGTVENANTTTSVAYTPPEQRTVKDVAEVKIESGTVGNGDSGGPFFIQASPGVLLGTFVSYTPEKAGAEVGTIGTFQLLSASFANLGTKFELLTTKNEKRHNPVFWSDESPATIDGAQVGQLVFKRSGRTVKCETATFAGTAESDVGTVTLTPTYGNCTATIGETALPATVKMNGCDYLFHVEAETVAEADTFGASMDLVCPEKPVEVDIFANHANHTVGTALCRYTLGSQSLETIDLTNKAAGGGAPQDWIEAHMGLVGISSQRTFGTLANCGTASDTGGTLEGDVALTGTTEGEEPTAIMANTG